MKSKLFKVILLTWLIIGPAADGLPLLPQTLIIPPINEGIKQNSYLRHYTGAFYDTEALKQHRRTRRDLSSSSSSSNAMGKRAGAALNLHLNAFDRIFKMKLVRDSNIFHQDARFETSNGRSIDPLDVYTGSLEDDDSAVVHGIITEDGLFDGTIITSSDEIYIEPAARYSRLVRSNIGHHTIAYRSSDVMATPSHFHPCSTTISERTLVTTNEPHHYVNSSHAMWNVTSMYEANQFYHLDLLMPDDDIQSLNFSPAHGIAVHHSSERENLQDPKKTTCLLYLQADHTFLNHYKSEEACIEVMTRHVQRVNSIYRYTDFNQDGHADNISFMIKRVKIHGSDALHDKMYRFNGKYGVEEYLEIFSEENYDAFCLAYMFTYRDFEKGTLGLAWTGDLKNAGGVCEKNGHYRGSMKSLNTGIITLLNYGKHVPPAVSHVTLAHEIGHNFGSPHDPDACTPGGEDGNFIMFARATSGDKRNNNRFSPCSLISINPVLNVKARSPDKGCFAEYQVAICGNGVVEEGEECDCGWEEDCNDPCCHPQRLHHAPFEIPCRLTEDAVCSPSQGPCCTADGCSLRSGTKCRDDNGCRDASFCDGRGPQCPVSINKPNKTICNQEFVCYMGECTGSICLAYGLESCQCTAGPNDPLTKTCELCCKLPGEDQPCISSFAWNSPPYEIPDMMSKPGTPCNDYNGYCDIFQRCREVDPTGPLATLRRLLLSDASLARFQRWITDRRWYAVTLGILAALTGLMVGGAQLLLQQAKRSDSHQLKILQFCSSSKDSDADADNGHQQKNQSSSAPAVNALGNISRIKRQIVETMKIIASPRKTNNSILSSRGSSSIDSENNHQVNYAQNHKLHKNSIFLQFIERIFMQKSRNVEINQLDIKNCNNGIIITNSPHRVSIYKSGQISDLEMLVRSS